MIIPAIVAIGYNRPDSLHRLLRSIGQANYDREDITLVISLDYCNDQQKVIDVAEQFEWQHGKKIIRTHKANMGLRAHVLSCGDLALIYGGVIILEDDIVVSPAYYHYTFRAMNHYEGDPHIAGTALYSHAFNGYARQRFTPLHNGYDAFYAMFGVSWGQAWSASQWQQFRSWYDQHSGPLPYREDLPLSINTWGKKSWGKYFLHYQLDQKKYYVIPYCAVATCYADAGENIKSATLDHQTFLAINGPEEYRFPTFEESVHYDLFFENQDLVDVVREQYDLPDTAKILIDLYGLRAGSWKADYILTTRTLPYIQIGSYALHMRPIEMNVILRASGQGIRLYKVTKGQLMLSEKKIDHSYGRLNYEAEGMPWQSALKYGFIRAWYGGIATLQFYIRRIMK